LNPGASGQPHEYMFFLPTASDLLYLFKAERLERKDTEQETRERRKKNNKKPVRESGLAFFFLKKIIRPCRDG